jgi:hypothetical protein
VKRRRDIVRHVAVFSALGGICFGAVASAGQAGATGGARAAIGSLAVGLAGIYLLGRQSARGSTAVAVASAVAVAVAEAVAHAKAEATAQALAQVQVYVQQHTGHELQIGADTPVLAVESMDTHIGRVLDSSSERVGAKEDVRSIG